MLQGIAPVATYSDGFTSPLQFSNGKPIKINALTHPDHLSLSPMWYKWRLSYVGGEDFKRVYLKKYSEREDPVSFYDRRVMSYVPAFAKTGIDEIRNSITQRLSDITRVTTSDTYNRAVEGKDGGVDRRGSTMKYFLGDQVLTELLVMGKVGIYVDSPREHASNYLQSHKLKPYMYIYKAEQIRSWTQDDNGNLLTLLLEDVDYDFDKDFQLPISNTVRYRYFWFDDGGKVRCQIYNTEGEPTDVEIALNLTEIPFHILEISASLMTEICDYQIALMNMASSDVQFSRLANYPLYVEKYNPMTETVNQLRSGTNAINANDRNPATDGSQQKTTGSAARTEKIGGTLTGRKIAQELDFPEWVSPDTSSIAASMAKQEQMKEEIRTLLFLSLGNLQDNKQSADSKQQDVSQEENGLSYIGFQLELAENKICCYWKAYENNTDDFTIKYPQTYDIKKVGERIDEATKLSTLVQLVPSLTYKKELTKMVAKSLLSGRTPYDLMQKIYSEVDNCQAIVDPEQMALDIENRLVSHEFASKVSGYPAGEAKQANEEAIEHAAEIMKAQTPPEMPDQQTDGPIKNPAARGVPALSANPKADIKNDRNKNGPYKPRGKGNKPSADSKVGTA